MTKLAGVWTYRSFFNLPLVDKFDELRFAEAELTLTETETPDFLLGRLSFGEAYLEIVAFVTPAADRQALRMRATGVQGTPTEGWIYDYRGHLASTWEHGDRQRPALVGTVIRTAPHDPNREAGFSASFIAVSREAPLPRYELPTQVVEHFGARLHRLHHAAWHGVRNAWDVMQAEMREAVTALDWATPRPARAYGRDGVFLKPHLTNGSGEDFLFFHRQMVVSYKRLMEDADETPREWTLIPEPGDANHPVPSPWPVPGEGAFERRIAALKTDAYYWTQMRSWDQEFKDPLYLATLTLGELGSLIEFSVHNDMHMRWSGAPRDPVSNALLTSGRPWYDFSPKWDEPAYDWLGEFYSSHVNPFFWRLHGWIDDRIEDWFAAHEQRHPGEVRSVSKGGVNWFEPGRWVLVDKPWVWPDSLGGFEAGHVGHYDTYKRNGAQDQADHHGRLGHSGAEAEKLASLEALVAVLYPPPEPFAALTAGVAPSIDPVLGRALSPIVGFGETSSLAS